MRAALLRLLLALPLTASVLRAQAPRDAGPPERADTASHEVTWCAARADSVRWRLQTVYLVLKERASRDSLPLEDPLPRPYLGLVLESIRPGFRAASGLAPTLTSGSTARLPAGEPRYSVASIFGHLRFDLRGDGTVDSLQLESVRDSALARDLAAALAAAQASGELPPYGSADDRRHFMLIPELQPDSSAASWPAFVLDAPEFRPVIPMKGPPIKYPRELIGWNANLRFLFVVDSTGQVDTTTIRAIPAPDSVAWDDPRKKQVYSAFVAQTARGIAVARFRPAEVMGCRVRQLVVQPFNFRTTH